MSLEHVSKPGRVFILMGHWSRDPTAIIVLFRRQINKLGLALDSVMLLHDLLESVLERRSQVVHRVLTLKVAYVRQVQLSIYIF